MTTTSLDPSHQLDRIGLAQVTTDIVATSKLISQGTLTVDGASTLTGVATLTAAAVFTGGGAFAVMPTIPTATVAATGSTQTDAAAITTGFTLVSAADATKGVKLPTAAAGKVCIVKNADAANAVLKIWPFSGDGVNAVSVDSAFSIAAKTAVLLVAYDATTWYSVPLLPS